MEVQDIFLNRAGRLRSGWRVAIFAVLLYFAILISFMLVVAVVRASFGSRADGVLESNWGFVMQGLVLLIPATVIGWACGKILEDLPPRALGWAFHKGWLRDLLLGSLIGALSLLENKRDTNPPKKHGNIPL